MLRKLFATEDSAATSLLRLALGVVFFAHGAQKMLGWFGGPGFSGTMSMFTGYMHIPAPFAFLDAALCDLAQRPMAPRQHQPQARRLNRSPPAHEGARLGCAVGDVVAIA